MTKAEALENLKNSMIEVDPSVASKVAIAARALGIDAEEAIEKGLSQGMEIVSRLFVEGTFFVPDLFLAAKAFETAVDILKGNASVKDPLESLALQ